MLNECGLAEAHVRVAEDECLMLLHGVLEVLHHPTFCSDSHANRGFENLLLGE
jgi:hypothetical protein